LKKIQRKQLDEAQISVPGQRLDLLFGLLILEELGILIQVFVDGLKKCGKI